MRKTIAFAALLALTVPATAAARPADVVIVNTAPVPVEVRGTPTVSLGDQPVETRQAGWSAYTEVIAASTDTRRCSSVPMPASGRYTVQSVNVTAYYAPTMPTVYLLPIVKKASGVGRFMHMRIPLSTSAPDPVANMRYGSLTAPFTIRGGGIGAAEVGDVYSMTACTTNVSGEAVEVSFQFNGVRVG